MIHDDDIEVGTRCLWFEPRKDGQKIISTIDKVSREDDGFVRGVHARSETGDFSRSFGRHRDEAYFVCGRFLLYVGSWDPPQDELDRLAKAWHESLRDLRAVPTGPDDDP